MDNYMKGLVSIVIPTHNCADYICEAVESCLSQTYKLIEIIVVDDGSTDDTKQKLREYIDQASIKYIYQENGERSKARNEGIKIAQGEFIQLLDVDDLLEREKIEKQVDFLQGNAGCFGVYCEAKHFGQVEKRFLKSPQVHTGAITRDIIKGNFILINTMLTRRANVFFDERLNTLEDWDYWFTISLNGRQFGYIDEKLCLVRRHEKNTSKNGLAMLRGELEVLHKMETAGVYLGEVKYYMFERMYALGMKGAWKALRESMAIDIKKAFVGLLFIAKTAARRALEYLGDAT